jgi:hypothetical protein
MPQILEGSSYDGFAASRAHFESNGLAMMATAGPYPSPAQVVALNGGLSFDVVVCQATRKGEPPAMPTPKTMNPNRVLLNGGRWGTFPMIEVNGVRTYSIGVWYLFGIITPEGLASDFMLGELPFPGLNATDQYIPGSYFNYELINGTLTQVLTPIPTQPNFLSGIIGKS